MLFSEDKPEDKLLFFIWFYQQKPHLPSPEEEIPLLLLRML